MGPNEINIHENSLKKYQTVYRSLEKKAKAEDKIIIEKMVPFPRDDLINSQCLD